MERQEFDAVVLGLGAMGSAALYHLGRRGIPALGLEQFPLGHDRGSTHGPSRVFRPIYAEAVYVALARAAQTQWRELERRSGTELLRLCGQLVFAQPENALLQESLANLRETGEDHSLLTDAQVAERFPMLRLPDHSVACWVPRAGILEPDNALRTIISEARLAGAIARGSQRVLALEPQGDQISVTTADSRILCRRLICTGGSWTSALLPELDLDLTVTRQQKFHFKSPEASSLRPDRVPVYADYDRNYYGFPVWRDILNVADDNWGEPVNPDAVDRTPDRDTLDRVAQWVEQLFPGHAWEHVHTETCLYTNTPDDDFILDRHPAMPNVVIGAGFSGHGFKFTPVIGELLVQLALEEMPTVDIQDLSMHAGRRLTTQD